MGIRKRKGFTLVELIVVIAIFGIVSMVIMTIFLATNKTFVEAEKLYKEQTESRYALNLVKNELGTAKNVVIYEAVPDTLPTTGGYCYYDTTSRHLRLRLMSGATYDLFNTLSINESIQILFAAVSNNGKLNAVNLDWTVGNYHLATDVFIQNIGTDGSVTTDYDISGNPLPGIYVEFN